MSPRVLIIFCGILTAIGAFSTDILLPAFSNLERGLGTSMEMVQLTIPLFTFSFGVCQFFMGSLTDRFGRRPVILAGITLYVVGGLVAVIYPSIELVLLARILQGAGASVGQVAARAILRDKYSGRELASSMAMMTAIFAFGPIVAPLIGAVFSIGDAWRPGFLFMALFGISVLAAAFFKLPETIAIKNPDATRLRVVKANLVTVLSDSQVRYFLTIASLAFIALFSYIVNSAPVYLNEFGVEKLEFGILFAATGIGIIVGQYVNARAVKRFGVLPCMRVASLIVTACSLCIVLLSLGDMLTKINLTFIMLAFNTSFLVIYSNAAATIIDRHPTIAGFTSSVFGLATQFLVPLVIAATIPLIAGKALNWGVLMSLANLAALFMLWRWADKPIAD